MAFRASLQRGAYASQRNEWGAAATSEECALNNLHITIQRGLEPCTGYGMLIDGVRDFPDPYLKGDERGAHT